MFFLPSFCRQTYWKEVVISEEEYFGHDDLNLCYKSANRRGYSTDIVLLKFLSDLSEAIDETSMTALVIWCLSAAFYVTDHRIILKQLIFYFFGY